MHNKFFLKSIFLVIFALLFSACSSKKPAINFDELSTANICQSKSILDEKLKCYNDILDSNSYAQLRVGIYFSQKGEYKKAIELFNKSLSNDNINAKYALAFMYLNGFGVEKDLKQSFKLLDSSKDFIPSSAYQLAIFYFEGIYVSKDSTEALDLLEYAANKGMKEAQSKLFNIYSNGLYNIPKDEIKASYWGVELKSKKEDKSKDIFKL